MKRFKCSLQRVLDVREAVVSRCEAQLAESERALAARRAEQEAYRAALSEASRREVETHMRQPTRPVAECRAHRAWYEHLTDCLHRTHRAAEQEHGRVNQRRAELQKAMMDQKVIENLSQRERYDWLERLRRSEQKDMDEAASQRQRHRRYTTEDSMSGSTPVAGSL